jgi:hypothetical protein
MDALESIVNFLQKKMSYRKKLSDGGISNIFLIWLPKPQKQPELIRENTKMWGTCWSFRAMVFYNNLFHLIVGPIPKAKKQCATWGVREGLRSALGSRK